MTNINILPQEDKDGNQLLFKMRELFNPANMKHTESCLESQTTAITSKITRSDNQ